MSNIVRLARKGGDRSLSSVLEFAHNRIREGKTKHLLIVEMGSETPGAPLAPSFSTSDLTETDAPTILLMVGSLEAMKRELLGHLDMD